MFGFWRKFLRIQCYVINVFHLLGFVPFWLWQELLATVSPASWQTLTNQLNRCNTPWLLYIERYSVTVFPRMAYTEFMTAGMLHCLESYPRIIPMVLKPCFETSGESYLYSYLRNIPRIILPNHTSHAKRFPDTGMHTCSSV